MAIEAVADVTGVGVTTFGEAEVVLTTMVLGVGDDEATEEDQTAQVEDGATADEDQTAQEEEDTGGAGTELGLTGLGGAGAEEELHGPQD